MPAPDVYGPQTKHIVHLIGQSATLTPLQGEALRNAWDETQHDTWDAARDATLKAAEQSGREHLWDAARYAAAEAARGVTLQVSWPADHDASCVTGALAVRDLIGQHGFRQTDYDTLTFRWRTIVGAVHPDDTHPVDSWGTGERQMVAALLGNWHDTPDALVQTVTDLAASTDTHGR